MAAKNFIVAIELGSTKITGIAGQKKPDGSISVLAVVREDATQCIRKGVVYNIDKTVQCITNIVQHLRTQLHTGIKHVYVGVGGQSIHSERNIMVRDLTDGASVSSDLVDDMMDANSALEYPEMEILDVIPQEYRADSLLQIDPVGIQCSHLEGLYLNILQNRRHYNKLNMCFEHAGVKIAELYLAPFALADAVLTAVEKRSGCVLIDLGADTTTVMVYYKDIVRHIAVIPLGAGNITKDICSLPVEESEAEKLKLKYASAYTAVEDIDTSMKYEIDSERIIDSSRFIELVEARVYEIIANAWNQVPSEFSERLMGGIILTGGGSNLKNIDIAFRKQTNVEKVRIANFVTYTIVSNNSEVNAHDGTMNTAIGLLAKGDQNCWQPEETRTRGIFEDNSATSTEQSQTEEIETRDINDLPPGVILTAAEKAAAEKKIADAKAKEEAEKAAQEQARAEEEARAKAEADKNLKQGKGIMARVIKFFADVTKPDEE